MADQELKIIISAKDQGASGVLSGIGGALKGIAGIGLGAVATGIGAIGAGLGIAGKVGLGFNNTMEQVTAQLNAFTKDGAESARILNYLTQEAAKTPFAFEEMARATAGLMPAAKASGIELEKLVSLSEILAASNPAQGLEGAAFSLREALSGDFVSIVERFNLPRQRLKELKEQGVPALEAISTAMKEMGLDADLVTNLSQTASGRLSTFKDTLTGLAATATQPIFNAFSEGLGQLNDKLSIAAPAFQDFLTNIIGGDKTAGLQDLQRGLLQLGFPPEKVTEISDSVSNIIDSIGTLQDSLSGISTADIAAAIGTVVDVIEGLAWAIQKVNEALKIGAGLYDQLSTILGAGQTIGAGGNAFNAASMGGQAPGGFPGVPNVNNNIQLNPTPVTINLDGKTIAENTSSYQGGGYLDYLAMGGIGAQ